jgi:hypothetical protein
MVADDRASQLEAVVLHLDDAVALGERRLRAVVVPRPRLPEVVLIDVRADHAVIRVVEVAAPPPVVGAAAGDHVEHDAAGRDGGVVAAGAHLDLLERVEIEVARRRADRGHVRDHHAVQRPDRLAARRARTDEADLVPAQVAAHVDPLHQHARRGLEDGPRIADRRHVLQLGAGDRGAAGEAALVQEGSLLAGDRESLLDRGRKRDHDFQVAPDADEQALVLDRRMAVEMGIQVILAGRQAREPEPALLIRDLHLRRATSRERHRRSRQRSPLRIAYRSEKAPGLELRAQGRGKDRGQRDGEDGQTTLGKPHLSPPFQIPAGIWSAIAQGACPSGCKPMAGGGARPGSGTSS